MDWSTNRVCSVSNLEEGKVTVPLPNPQPAETFDSYLSEHQCVPNVLVIKIPTR